MGMLKTFVRRYPNCVALLVFTTFSILLLLPQVVTKGMLVGDDLVFHYNRFYETAMQLKHGNFSYFISLYGYQQSGRIVNALYGPYFAYLQGLLVLISGSWFRYQLLSNFLLSLLASSSLYIFLRKLKVLYTYALYLALVFTTTYSIQYWWLNQGLSSWGLALFPLSLLPAIDLLKEQKIAVFPIAGAVALILQVHVLSALFLALAYLIFFAWGWLKSEQKWFLIGKLVQSIALFSLLTINVWLPLIDLNANNELITPFVNKNLALNTITERNQHLLFYPNSLVLLYFILLLTYLKKVGKSSDLLSALTAVYLLFMMMASNLFPWHLVAGKGIKLIELIQFPYRFFLYANIFFLAILGLRLSLYQRWRQLTIVCLSMVLLGALVFSWQTSTRAIDRYQSQDFLTKRANTIASAPLVELRKSLYSKDLGRFLTLVGNASPDYLPKKVKGIQTSQGHDLGKSSTLYRHYVICQNQQLKKTTSYHQVCLSWKSETEQEVTLPLVAYKNSRLRLNGHQLRSKEYRLNPIGNPRLRVKPGYHSLTLTYQNPSWLTGILLLNLVVWGVWLIDSGRRTFGGVIILK